MSNPCPADSSGSKPRTQEKFYSSVSQIMHCKMDGLGPPVLKHRICDEHKRYKQNYSKFYPTDDEVKGGTKQKQKNIIVKN